MKTTREIFPDFSDAIIKYYDQRLLNETGNGYIDLAAFHGSVHNANSEKTTTSEIDIYTEREQTLMYLSKLLKRSIIKIGKHAGDASIAKEYTGTPDEIINTLRTEWINTVEGVVNKNSGAFEMCTHITLKDNPWPVWR